METRKGLTLVELLIVVLILAALSAIAISIISGSAHKAKIAECDANIADINQKLADYQAENEGIHPLSIEQCYPDGNVPKCLFGESYNIIREGDVETVDPTGHDHER